MLCKAVNWGSAAHVQEAYRLLNEWHAIDADVALQLLDKTFPDPKARLFSNVNVVCVAFVVETERARL